ncbi:MAG: hypothetical protein KatS3mg103_0732 [Phycisphaerales bacterium]|nr:MAG: hypothetical protein KatS3mg103_0732 [Phycisphaerales bacterium]
MVPRKWVAGGLAWVLAGWLAASGCAGPGTAGGGRQAGDGAGGSAVLDAVALSTARERAIAALEGLAEHPDPVVRANALEALLEAPGRAERWLAKGLADPNPGVRAVALMGIGKGGYRTLALQAEPLLEDPSAMVRVNAAYALATAGRDGGMPILAQVLLGSDRPPERAQAAFVLGELGNRSALPLLREAAAKAMPMAPAGQVRLMALQMSEAMVKLGDQEQIQPIRAALYPARPEDLEATALAARILGEVGDHGSENQLVLLTARLDDRGNMMPPEVRLSAVYALAQLGRRQGDVFALAYLDDPSPSVRALAALCLGAIGKAEHLPAVEGLLADPDPGVRVHAAAAVVRLTRP